MIARAAKQAARDTAPPPAPSRLLHLPVELLRHVLEYLCLHSLQFAGATCGQLRRETAAPDLVKAVARRSDEFWAPLLYDEAARSKIAHLLPRTGADAVPSLGDLRRYFSGTRRPDPLARELFLYGTVERGCEVVATFGPADADKVKTDIGNSNEFDLATLDIPLDWKSPVVKEAYCTEPQFQAVYLNKTVTISVYAITGSGTYLVSEMPIEAGLLPFTILMNMQFMIQHEMQREAMTSFLYDNLNKASFAFQVVNDNFRPFEDGTKAKGRQANAIYLQISRYFRPTHREVIELE